MSGRRLAALLLCAAGCASRSAPPRAPVASALDPRSEISQLEQDIAGRFGAIGADPPPREAPAREERPVVPPPGAAAPSPVSTAGAPPPAAAAEVTASSAPEAAPAVSEPPRGTTTARARGGRCRAAGEVGAEICRAAERICVLARQLDEASAQRSCDRASDDCRRARAAAANCR